MSMSVEATLLRDSENARRHARLTVAASVETRLGVQLTRVEARAIRAEAAQVRAKVDRDSAARARPPKA